MARNEEKAMTLWNKWTTFRHEFHAKGSNKKPLVSSECDSLIEAEKQRRIVLGDIMKKIGDSFPLFHQRMLDYIF
jgi:hypothetical protein